MVLWWFKIGRLNLAQVRGDFLKVQVGRAKNPVGGDCGRLEVGIGGRVVDEVVLKSEQVCRAVWKAF